MKIGLVSPYDYPFPGGVTAHIEHLDREFTKLGHEVIIIAPSSKDETELDHGKVRKVGNVVPIRANGSVARITLSLRMVGRVKRILRAERFDVVHIHEPLVPGLPLSVLNHSRSINIGTFHAYWGMNLRYFYSNYNPWLRYYAKRLHGRVAVSAAAKRFASRHFPGEYEIIPNGIDPERFGSHVEPFSQFRGDGKLNIVFVGRLEKRKGFAYLLRAFRRIKAEMPEARLLVAGAYSPKAANRYLAYVSKAKLMDVHFLGYLSFEELPRCYKTADVFCAPSTGGESFGIVLLEAMASGVPIVASDIEGYRAVVHHGVEGLLVPAKDDERLAEALLSLLRDSSIRKAMGEAGVVNAQQYGWEIVAKRLLDFYARVSARRAQMKKEKAQGRKNKRTRRGIKHRWLRTRRWAGRWIDPVRWTKRLFRV